MLQTLAHARRPYSQLESERGAPRVRVLEHLTVRCVSHDVGHDEVTHLDLVPVPNLHVGVGQTRRHRHDVPLSVHALVHPRGVHWRSRCAQLALEFNLGRVLVVPLRIGDTHDVLVERLEVHRERGCREGRGQDRGEHRTPGCLIRRHVVAARLGWDARMGRAGRTRGDTAASLRRCHDGPMDGGDEAASHHVP